MQIDKSKTLKDIEFCIGNFIDKISTIQNKNIDEFSCKNTIIVMIDMVNGFCKFGALSSEHVKNLIPNMSIFLDKCVAKNIPIIAYQDSHVSQNAKEFELYPPHCIQGSDECEIVSELKRDCLKIIPKNSTNGFLAYNLFDEYKNIQNIVVIGCVSDICIKDFSCTISKYVQEKNIDAQVYVAQNLIDTFEMQNVHFREAEHVLALYMMEKCGVKIINIF